MDPAYIAHREKANEYQRNRYETDESFRILNNFRSRMGGFLRDCGATKCDHTYDLVQCSLNDLIAFLNDNDRGLKYGDKGVVIDHIRPLASFIAFITCKIQQYMAFGFNNLQLLTAEENRIKSDTFTEQDAFEYAESDRGIAIAVMQSSMISDGVCNCEFCHL